MAGKRRAKAEKSAVEASMKPPRVRDLVAEGLYIAAAATRLRLKNRILVETIAGGDTFDVDHFVAEARETLRELADEAEAEGKRVRKEGKGAWRRFDDSAGTHDYRSRDMRNLKRRRRQAEHTARALRARAEDDEALRELVEAARDVAWSEVARNIDSSLRIEAARPDLDSDYERMRGARMQALRLVDLTKLKQQQKRRERIAKDGPDLVPGGQAGSVASTPAARAKKERPFVPEVGGDVAAHARARGIDVGELED